jgi:cytochrome c5
MKTLLTTTAAAILLTASCLRGADAKPVEPATTDAEGVRSITLPVVETELPPGPGREVIVTNCIVCHSNRYISMQPRFSKEAWTGTVDKMRKTFGAPVNEQQAAQAVEYLFAVKGNGEQKQPAKAPTPQNPSGDVQKK